MSNLYQALGFPMHSEEELIGWIMRAAEEGDPVSAGEVDYLRWRAGGGAELWLQVREDGGIVAVEPHLDGKARMRVALTARVVEDDAPVGQGALHGWADPSDEADPESGHYPFVFNVPDFRTCDGLPLPGVMDVQLAALTYELEAFPSEEAYLAGQSGKLTYAPESFIPAGLFVGDGTPRPDAMFTGRVLQTERRVNEASGGAFVWARVRMLGGEIEVAADPSIVRGEIVPGGIVTGSFWMTGRVSAAPLAALH